MSENLESKHIKCVNFDLSTEELKKHFPNGTTKAYELLKQFFLERDFEHRQKSGYISKKPLDEYQIDLIAKKLGSNFAWLKECMQEFDVSNAPDKVSIKEAIVNSIEETAQKKKTKIQMLTERLDREVAYYEKSKNSFYAEAKIRIENTIIGLCNELMQNGETIKDKNLKTFQTIIKERNGGRGL